MSDDIKEILARLNKIGFYASVPKELAYMTANITPQECKTILDYITNLQQKEELFEKIVYKYDELKQENERLEKELKQWKKKYGK